MLTLVSVIFPECENEGSRYISVTVGAGQVVIAKVITTCLAATNPGTVHQSRGL